MPKIQVFVVAALVFPAVFVRADCTKNRDHRSNKDSGLSITDFTIRGTQTLSSDELSTIASEMTVSCFDEKSDEIEERIRALLKDRGYFSA